MLWRISGGSTKFEKDGDRGLFLQDVFSEKQKKSRDCLSNYITPSGHRLGHTFLKERMTVK